MPKKQRPDPQMVALYTAELTTDPGLEVPTVADAQIIVDSFLRDPWVQNRWPSVLGVKVMDGRGSETSNAELYDGTGVHVAYIKLLKVHLFVRDLIHEFAHVCTDADEMLRYPDQREPQTWEDHGKEYAGIFIELTEHFRGHKQAKVLRKAFRDNGVAFRRRRVLK